MSWFQNERRMGRWVAVTKAAVIGHGALQQSVWCASAACGGLTVSQLSAVSWRPQAGDGRAACVLRGAA